MYICFRIFQFLIIIIIDVWHEAKSLIINKDYILAIEYDRILTL